ncbi:MAG: hypothetical protein NC489_08230 [Ruminococcus flavefaciens]|nr:hypothetical protein [Ruminococcus flavefaciens]
MKKFKFTPVDITPPEMPKMSNVKPPCPRSTPSKLIHPRIIIDDICDYVVNKIGVKLDHMPNETIPIALIKLQQDQFFGSLVYMSSHEVKGIKLPNAHSVSCMISPIALYKDYGTVTFDVVDEGNGTIVPLTTVPDFVDFSAHHTDFIRDIFTMLDKTPFMRINGRREFARYEDIERIVIDCNNCEMIDEDGYTIVDNIGGVRRGPEPKPKND